MRFSTNDPNIHLEDTGLIKVHNYPPSSHMTYSYVTRIYKQIDKNKFGYTEVDGEPIYFHDLPTNELALAIIIGNAQNALSNTLKRENYLKQIKAK